MSYILEALKKADQERDVGAVPNLATAPQAGRPQTRSRRWLWLVGALLFVNIVLVAMLLLNDSGAEAPAAAQAPAERSAPRIDDPPAPSAQRSSQSPIDTAPVPKTPTPGRSQPTKSGGGLVMLPEPGQSRNSAPPVVEAEPATRADAAPTKTDFSQLQSWYELPLDFRNRLDLPRLDLHVYSEEPKDRFILVDFKKYREGERLESGIVLEEIFPDGMVMSYRGERFLVEK